MTNLSNKLSVDLKLKTVPQTCSYSSEYMPEHQKPFYPRYHLSGGLLCPPADFGSLLKKPQPGTGLP